MADYYSAELEAEFQLRDQLIEASEFLRDRGQPGLRSLILSLLDPDCIGEAMSELEEMTELEEEAGGDDFSDDPTLFEEFYHTIRTHLLNLREAGYDDDEEIPEAILLMLLQATQRAASRLVQPYDIYDTTIQQLFRSDGSGLRAVPAPRTASAAAVRSLEKQTFRAATGEKEKSVAEGGCCGGLTECSICFEEFVDGVQVSVMPCPSSSRGHRFHSDCIAKWLGISNTCPLCRHQLNCLPAAV